MNDIDISIDPSIINTLIISLYGDRLVNNTYLQLTDDDTATVIKYQFKKRWEYLNNEVEEIGEVERKTITETISDNANNTTTNERTKSENSLNNDEFINTDRIGVDKQTDSMSDRQRTYEEVITDRSIKEKDLTTLNDLCYTIASDIVNCLTLDFY